MYTQSITRSHRTAFILAIDQSGSMAEKLLFRGRQTTKAEAVAEVTNRLLFELIERARRSDEVRDYYDIAVLGYSGDGIVSLLNDPEPLVPVSRLAALPVDFAETVVERRMPDGEATFRKISMPAWIAPKAVGQTPMYEALLQIRDDTSVVHESGPQRKFSAHRLQHHRRGSLGLRPARTARDLRKDPHHRNHRRQGARSTSISPPRPTHVRCSFRPKRRFPPTTATQDCCTTVRVRCPKSFQRRSDRCGAIWPNHPSGNELQHVDRRTHRHPQHRLDQHQNTVKDDRSHPL